MPIVWNDNIKVFPDPNMVTDIVTVQVTIQSSPTNSLSANKQSIVSNSNS